MDISPHYTILYIYCITLPYIALQNITLHYIALYLIALDHIKLDCSAFHYIPTYRTCMYIDIYIHNYKPNYVKPTLIHGNIVAHLMVIT